jgi:hypothetical protein
MMGTSVSNTATGRDKEDGRQGAKWADHSQVENQTHAFIWHYLRTPTGESASLLLKGLVDYCLDLRGSVWTLGLPLLLLLLLLLTHYLARSRAAAHLLEGIHGRSHAPEEWKTRSLLGMPKGTNRRRQNNCVMSVTINGCYVHMEV